MTDKEFVIANVKGVEDYINLLDSLLRSGYFMKRNNEQSIVTELCVLETQIIRAVFRMINRKFGDGGFVFLDMNLEYSVVREDSDWSINFGRILNTSDAYSLFATVIKSMQSFDGTAYREVRDIVSKYYGVLKANLVAFRKLVSGKDIGVHIINQQRVIIDDIVSAIFDEINTIIGEDKFVLRKYDRYAYNFKYRFFLLSAEADNFSKVYEKSPDTFELDTYRENQIEETFIKVAFRMVEILKQGSEDNVHQSEND